MPPATLCPASSPAGNPSPEVDAAHWRALQSLAQLALAAGAAPPDHSVAVSVLQQVAAGSLPQLSERDGTDLSADASAALLPGLIQLQVPPAPGRYCCSQVRKRCGCWGVSSRCLLRGAPEAG